MNIGRKPLTDADFLVLWMSIEKEMHKLAAGGLCSAAQIYNCIYIVCTSPTTKFESKLYWKIGDFIYMRSKEIRREIFEASEWVEAYNTGFRRFKEMVFAINELCDFLNECVNGRTIQDFGFLLWERCILQQTMKHKHTTLGYELVNHSRMEVVREAIESFRLVVPDPRHPMLYYTQRYEQLALQRIRARYEEEIYSMSIDVEGYSSYVKEKMLYEKSIQDKIFLEESWPKVEAVLEEVFILSRRGYLYAEIHRAISAHSLPIEILENISRCSADALQGLGKDVQDISSKERRMADAPDTEGQYVSSHPANDFYELQRFSLPCAPGRYDRFSSDALEKVSALYQNLSWLRSAYEILKSAFMQYISTECERHVHAYEKNTESIYLFYCMLRHVVEVGFMADTEYFKILKKEFSAVCTRLKPPLEVRLIDFSEAIACDDSSVFMFLNKSILSHKDSDTMDPLTFITDGRPLGSRPHASALEDVGGIFEDKGIALQRVFVALYKLIEKRQEFYEMYLARLSKRLLERTSSPHKEKKLISLMKRKGNQDFLRKAETMISDISISLHYNRDSNRFIWMLTQAYWPIQLEETGIQIPTSLAMIKKAYDFKFNKKRLYWAWNLGSVSVDILGYEITMNVPQYCIMDLFNKHEEISLDMALGKVKAGTKMTEDVLRSLMDSALVVRSEGGYRMSKSIKDVEADIVRFYRNESVEATHEIDRSTYYQSLISLTLKRNKKMKMKDIVADVRSKHTGCFECDEAILNESIRILIDKGIIEEAEHFYVYLP